MNKLQKAGGVTALLEACIYISAFVFFGVFWSFPTGAAAGQQFIFLAENQIILSVVNFIMYVLFGIFLAVLVLAVYERLKLSSPTLSKVSAIFGIIWVGLVIASGMIANIGLSAVLKLSENDPEQALIIWRTISYVVEGIGGGNEIVGGLWVLILSIAALKGKVFHKTLNILGVFVGVVGILTVYPAEIFTELFGIGQILWFVWLGVTMLLKSEDFQKQ